ncbi:MAG: Ig-like domain-containing protein [Microcoleus sp.]
MSFIGNIPIVDGIQLADANPAQANTVNYTVTFNQSVTGVDIADFTLKSIGVTGASIAAVTGSGALYNVSVNTGQGSGTVGLNVVDNDSINNSLAIPLGDVGLGNGNFTGPTYTIDKTPPTVSLAPVTPDPRNTSVSTIPITFSEPVTGFNIGDLTLTNNGVVVPLTGATLNTTNNTNWTLDNLTGLTGADGNYQLSLTAAGSGVVDRAGNALNTNASDIWSADFTAPTAATNLSNINAAGGSAYNFTVTYTDNTALNVSTLDSKDILVAGPDGKTQQATLVNFTPVGNGTPRTATYSFVPPGGTWDTADNGTYTVQLQSQQVSDTVGNFDVASNLGTFTVDIAPVVPPTPTTVVPPTTTTTIVPPTTTTIVTPPTTTTTIVPPTPTTTTVVPPTTTIVTPPTTPTVVTPPTPAPIVTPPTPTSIVTPPIPAPIVTAPIPTPAPTPEPTAIDTLTSFVQSLITATPTPTPAPTAIDTLTSIVTSLFGSIDTPTPAPTPPPTGTTATATAMRTPITITTRTPVFTAPPTLSRTVGDCASGGMPIARSTSAPAFTRISVQYDREDEYDSLTCPQQNPVNYRRSYSPRTTTCQPALTPKPIAYSAPNCASVAGDRDDDDFLIGNSINTNCGSSQQSDRFLTTTFSAIGASCVPETSQTSTFNNLHSFDLTTQVQLRHSTLVNTASQCQIRLI